MKKKPIYLYVLLGLSTVGTLWGLFSKFTSSDAGVKSILKQIEEPAKSQYATYFSKSAEVANSLANNFFFYGHIILLIVALFFLFRKDVFKANLIYIADVLVGLISTAYAYVVSKGIIASSFSDSTLLSAQMTGLNFSILFSVVISLIFLSIVIFKLVQQQKEAEKAELAANE